MYGVSTVIGEVSYYLPVSFRLLKKVWKMNQMLKKAEVI